jgi:hypothetical protein
MSNHVLKDAKKITFNYTDLQINSVADKKIGYFDRGPCSL